MLCLWHPRVEQRPPGTGTGTVTEAAGWLPAAGSARLNPGVVFSRFSPRPAGSPPLSVVCALRYPWLPALRARGAAPGASEQTLAPCAQGG